MSIANHPVYPSQPCDRQGNPICEAHAGITLLEHYAGLAMQGMLVNVGRNQFHFDRLDDMAKVAVTAAKALIAELEKTQP